MTTCQIDGCEQRVVGRGWCRLHYSRWHRHGDPLVVKIQRASGTPIERWWAKVDKQPGDGCWIWTGSPDRKGYGQFDVIEDGTHRNHRAHRWGYQQLVRSLLDDESIDHLCRVTACVNPSHLEPVTHAENVARGEAGLHNALKTHCAQGHPYDADNTVLDEHGWRICRSCRNEASKLAHRKRNGFQGGITSPDKTHCAQGHEFTSENTRIAARGGRVCKECARTATRESQRRRRAAEKEMPP